jgi:hypothetical protein
MHIESFIGRCQIDEINYWVQGYQDFPIFLHNLTVVGPETPITTSARCAPQTHKKSSVVAHAALQQGHPYRRAAVAWGPAARAPHQSMNQPITHGIEKA